MRQEQPLFCESTSQEDEARETLNKMLDNAPQKQVEEFKQEIYPEPVQDAKTN